MPRQPSPALCQRALWLFICVVWLDEEYILPGCVNHANTLLLPSSVTSVSPPFLPLISLLFCSCTPCGHLENVNCDRSTGSNLIKNFRSRLPSAAMGYCGGECEIVFNLWKPLNALVYCENPSLACETWSWLIPHKCALIQDPLLLLQM